MTNYLVQRFLWFRERGFVQITQKTLVSLFPFFLFSGIIRVISLSVFSELGYINQLFSVSDWLPAFKITGQVLINLSNFLGGLAGPLSTYFAGKYTAGHYGRSTGTAGVTSLLVSLNYRIAGAIAVTAKRWCFDSHQFTGFNQHYVGYLCWLSGWPDFSLFKS